MDRPGADAAGSAGTAVVLWAQTGLADTSTASARTEGRNLSATAATVSDYRRPPGTVEPRPAEASPATGQDRQQRDQRVVGEWHRLADGVDTIATGPSPGGGLGPVTFSDSQPLTRWNEESRGSWRPARVKNQEEES